MDTKNFSVWEGVYESFDEAGGDLDAFDTDIWLNKQRERIIKEFIQLGSNDFIPSNAVSKDYPLSLIVALLLTLQDTISILDFGGGMGNLYLELLAKVPNAASKVKYIIVENNAVIRSIPDEIINLPNLFFLNNFDLIEQPIHIIHFGSALQYMHDWQSLLKKLIMQFKPKYLSFSDLLAGPIPTFVSLQNYYGKKIPVWFWNITFFNSTLQPLYYDLIYKTFYKTTILNKEDFPNAALPETHRIAQTVNLIYCLKNSTCAK